MTIENSRLNVIIHGHVHGVGFRYFVLKNAVNLGLKGWVKNNIDGSVEVLAEGSKNKLLMLLNYLKIGPQLSYITKVEHNWSEYKDEFSQFNIVN